MKKLRIVKIGGNIVDDPMALEVFLEDFAAIEDLKILVHGGGKIATQVAAGLGIKAQMIDGRRVTDLEMLRVVTMVYGGLINKDIVVKLRAKNCNALGLTGADGGLIESQRRSPHPVDFGYVGDPRSVNIQTANTLLHSGIVPVVAPLTLGDSQLLNTNADTVAQTLATALVGVFDVDLEYKFEKRGVLTDIQNPDSVLTHMDRNIFENLKASGVIASGMIPKITNALEAIDKGVSNVFIGETRLCNIKS